MFFGREREGHREQVGTHGDEGENGGKCKADRSGVFEEITAQRPEVMVGAMTVPLHMPQGSHMGVSGGGNSASPIAHSLLLMMNAPPAAAKRPHL